MSSVRLVKMRDFLIAQRWPAAEERRKPVAGHFPHPIRRSTNSLANSPALQFGNPYCKLRRPQYEVSLQSGTSTTLSFMSQFILRPQAGLV